MAGNRRSRCSNPDRARGEKEAPTAKHTECIAVPQVVIKVPPAEQELLPGQVLTRLKKLDRDRCNERVAELHASAAPVVPALEQLANWAGTTPAAVRRSLNGSRRKPEPAKAMADLVELLHEVSDTGFRIQWRNAEVERAYLEELDRLFGQYLAKHESALEAWCRRGGTAKTLVRAVKVFDRLLTTILSNNNLG